MITPENDKNVYNANGKNVSYVTKCFQVTLRP